MKDLYKYYKACRHFGFSVKYSLHLVIFGRKTILRNLKYNKNYTTDLNKFGIK